MLKTSLFIPHLPGEETKETELQEMMTEVDMDGNGSINFEEFFRLMKNSELTDPEAENDMLDAFKVFDTEGNLSFQIT